MVSFTLADFGSNASLSTLRTSRYLKARKTRYMMNLTPPFMAGLSPARRAQLCLAHLYFLGTVELNNHLVEINNHSV